MAKFKTREEAFAKDYAEKSHHQESFNRKIIEGLARNVAQWFPNSAENPLHILDLCCGHGAPTLALLNALKDRGIAVETIRGYDISQEQIDKAKHLIGTNPRLEFKVQDAERIEDLNAYDVIVSLFGLHWMNDIKATAAKIHNALKPNGKLFFFVPLEKMDLFNLRQNLTQDPEWQTHFQGFSLRPFINNSDEYKTVFDNYFESIDAQEGATVKHYTTNEFSTFLSSWLPELRHLAKIGESAKSKDYIEQLINLIPSEPQKGRYVVRYEDNGEEKIQFTERHFTYSSARKREVSTTLEKPKGTVILPLALKTETLYPWAR